MTDKKTEFSDFVTLKEASKLLNKSDRTVKRYLDRLDNVDKNKMSVLSKGRVLISLDFIELVKNGGLPKNKKQQVEEGKSNQYKERVDRLEEQNKELFAIIQEKDKQLIEKDELIKENLRDFKMLTSKVLFLQEQNSKLLNVQDQTEVKGEPVQWKKGETNSVDALLLFLFVGFLLLIGVIFFLLAN